jgi:hypothetical protein
VALRSGHGNGRGMPRVEVLPVDELPRGVPGPAVRTTSAAATEASKALRTTGDPVAASELGRLGGLAKAARDRGLRVLEGLGLKGTPPELLAPYLADAEAFAVHETARLAAEVGGGACSPTVGSMIQTAALALAASRACYALGDFVAGSRLGNDSRQNLMAAFEICAREGAARKPSGHDVIREIQAEAAAWEAQRQRDARTLPEAGGTSSNEKPPSDPNLVAGNDEVDEPEGGGL